MPNAMEEPLRQQILNESIRIGDELLQKAETDTHGMSWKTIEQQGDQIYWTKSESIYTGISGIVLFFAELYRHTRQEKYLHAASEGIRWVDWYSQTHSVQSYAFLTGRNSISYTYLQLFTLTQKADYLEKALTHTKTHTEGPTPQLMEYINGLAGILVNLLHLHAASQEKWVLDRINAYVGVLISQIHVGKTGLHWDRTFMSIHGLCGFSHGAAGIGYVLLELGYYFHNPAFYWLAEQAFAYESQFFSPTLQNWFDLRKTMMTEEDENQFREAYQSGDLGFFTQTAHMNAWCHGAAGIGLSRLRGYQLVNTPQYVAEAELAIQYTKRTDLDSPVSGSFTLCHGSGGNAEIFLKAYEVLDDPYYLSLATQVAEKALNSQEKHKIYSSGTKYTGEDTSLFMGNAGVGYFYLRLLQPHQTPSVLIPTLQTQNQADLSNYTHLTASIGKIHQLILEQQFPRTLHLVVALYSQSIEIYLNAQTNDTPTHVVQSFVQWLEMQLETFPTSESERVKDVWTLENAKFQLNVSIQSDVLLHFKNSMKAQRAAVLGRLVPTDLLQTVLVMDLDMLLWQTQWQWNLTSPDVWIANLATEPDEYAVLLIPSLSHTVEQELSDFTQTVLSVFQEEKTVAAGIECIVSQVEDLEAEEIPLLQKLVLEQIEAAIHSGILIEPDQHPVLATSVHETIHQ